MPYQPILGQIMPFAGTVVPRGWALCNGAILAIQSNQALFSLIGTYYGGNGVTTFQLPNLQGRVILGVDSARTQYPPGAIGGEPAVQLTAAQLPSHTHVIQASTTQVASRFPVTPNGKIFAANTTPMSNPIKIFGPIRTNEAPLAAGTNVQNEGGNAAHNNMQPYLVISYLIAMQGSYPSRN